MAKLRHLAIACKDPDKMAEFYMKAFDFKLVRTGDGPLAYGHHISDGTIDLAILRFKSDQIGKGMDYTGLHHFGILVEDIDEVTKETLIAGLDLIGSTLLYADAIDEYERASDTFVPVAS